MKKSIRGGRGDDPVQTNLGYGHFQGLNSAGLGPTAASEVKSGLSRFAWPSRGRIEIEIEPRH